jgi:quercetin dioxygenase-like cupin family protein
VFRNTLRRVGSEVPEARLEDVGSGLAPVSPGWFTVNVRDAAWIKNEAFGARCLFEAGNPDVAARHFEHLGIKLAVFEPGQLSGFYHADSAEENFLVLQGECVARIEAEERPLRQWDFLHCAPGTHHGFIGSGHGPCVLLMVGARMPDRTFEYPEQGAGSSHEAYVGQPDWVPGSRPSVFG